MRLRLSAGLSISSLNLCGSSPADSPSVAASLVVRGRRAPCVCGDRTRVAIASPSLAGPCAYRRLLFLAKISQPSATGIAPVFLLQPPRALSDEAPARGGAHTNLHGEQLALFLLICVSRDAALRSLTAFKDSRFEFEKYVCRCISV